MLLRELIGIYCANHTGYITMCGQTVRNSPIQHLEHTVTAVLKMDNKPSVF